MDVEAICGGIPCIAGVGIDVEPCWIGANFGVLGSGLRLLSSLDEAALESTGGVPAEPLPDPTRSIGAGMIGTGVEPLASLRVMLFPLD